MRFKQKQKLIPLFILSLIFFGVSKLIPATMAAGTLIPGTECYNAENCVNDCNTGKYKETSGTYNCSQQDSGTSAIPAQQKIPNGIECASPTDCKSKCQKGTSTQVEDPNTLNPYYQCSANANAISGSSTGQSTPTQFTYTLLESFPGFFTGGTAAPDLPTMILAVYKFGIWTVGIAGLFMLVIGGFMYMVSAGNTAAAASAKKIIWDSLLGIVAAMSAYLILYVINPDLTRIDFSNFVAAGVETEGTGKSTAGVSTGNKTGSTTGLCTGTNAGCCKPGLSCIDCKNCINFSNNYSSLCYTGASGNTGCKLNDNLASRLNNANLNSVGAEVSEAWPPSVEHLSLCHQDGTCADVRCKISCKNETLANIKKIYDALKAVGLSPVYEDTAAGCARDTAAGIYCKTYPTMTTPSFHVNQ